MKRCKDCGEDKPLSDLSRMAGMRDGHRNECKGCHLAKRTARYDSAAAVARTQRWREQNAERYAEYRRTSSAGPERKRAMRDLYDRRTFGISADEFDAMLAAQGGGCHLRPPP